MFGYATDETEECMPLTIVLAHKLNAKMAELRRNGSIPWLRPDSKTQVRIKYHMLVFIFLSGIFMNTFNLTMKWILWSNGVKHNCVCPTGDRALWTERRSSDPQKSSHHCDLSPAWWLHLPGGAEEGAQREGTVPSKHGIFSDDYVLSVSLMFNLPCQVINAVVPAKYLDDKTIYHLQPSGRFVIGGPQVTPDSHALYSVQIENTYLLISGFFLLNRVTLELQAGKSSSTRTEAGELTEAGLSPAKTSQRWTAPPPMLPAG